MRLNKAEQRIDLLFIYAAVTLLLLLLISLPFRVRAEEVTLSPDDFWKINGELEGGNDVKLMPGETYRGVKIIARSNSSIDATGATIYGYGNIIISPCDIDCGEYDYRLRNFTVKGGTWKNTNEDGFNNSGIKIAFADNVVLDGLTMEYCNYKGHSIEIMASSNVTVQNCFIRSLGSPDKGLAEEQIQIDIASTAANAPFLPSQLLKGDTCHNIKILNNDVIGCRAVCANFTKAAYSGNCHTNITVEGNTLVGMTAEALALFNTTTATVKNNTCISYAKMKEATRTSNSDSFYSGCHIRLQKTVATGDAYDNRKITVTDNVFKGEQYGLRLGSSDTKGYKSMAVSDNHMYSAQNIEGAFRFDGVLKNAVSGKGNKRYKQSVANFSGETGTTAAKMVTAIKVKGSAKKVRVGKSIALKAVITPSGASMKKVTWKVSKGSYATVSNGGRVTAKKAGKGKSVTVWAVAQDGSGVISNKYKIKIKK